MAVGPLLKEWRRRRGLSQQDFALRAEVSTRHLSYVETGRSIPSRELVLHFAELLEVPLRERNGLLLAAGYAPVFSSRTLEDDSSGMPYVRGAVSRLLTSHEPYPALVKDRYWNVVDRNSSMARLTQGVGPELLDPPVNALRMALHPKGLAPRIMNLADWSGYLLRRLDHQVLVTGDPSLAALAKEVRSYPGVTEHSGFDAGGEERVVVPLQLRGDGVDLCLLNMVATFGTAVDVTAEELVIESFYPGDEATARVLATPLTGRDDHLSSGRPGLEDPVGFNHIAEGEDPNRLTLELARSHLIEDRPQGHLA
jgi:transcriptional regulator with XRE-family HTH domain